MEWEGKKELANGIQVEKIEPDILKYALPKDVEVTYEVIRALWELGNLAYPNTKRKVLVVFNSNFNPTKEAADFMVSFVRSEKVAAEAFCINSGALRLLTNFYFKIKKPVIPSKMFEDEKRAIAWLKEH